MVRMKIVIVTGTPGAGKSWLSKKLSKDLGFVHIDLNREIEKRGLYEGKDRKRSSLIVDESKISRFIDEILPEKAAGAVIDSHLSHFLSPGRTDLCIVLRADIEEIARRLKKRGYSSSKIRENIEAEIFGVCLDEAVSLGHTPLVVKSPVSKEEYANILKKIREIS